MSWASSSKKKDVTQKVQEIKQRQQNWLKQREQSKHDEAGSDKRTNNGQNKSQKKSTVPGNLSTVRKDRVGSSDSKPKPIRNQFTNWVNSRANKQATKIVAKDQIEFNDCQSIRSGAESELERLVSPDEYTAYPTQPVDESEFEDLADKIASRVKENLGLSVNSSASGISASTGITLMEEGPPYWSSARGQTFTQNAPKFNQIESSGLASHNCSVCKKLMLPSKNIPMMVIPCGHTLCKACSDKRNNCPSCDCPIVSLTVNIMLQQVIQEYHAHPVPSTLNSSSSPTKGRPEFFVEDNRRNKMASYKVQLVNLQTRHEVLSTEQKALEDHKNSLGLKIKQQRSQSQSIQRQEEELEKTISSLQDRLASLKEHSKQYENHLLELEDEKSLVVNKVTLLSATLKSLTREMEKVKLLSENEGD